MPTSRLELLTTWGRIAVSLSAGRVTACRLPRVPDVPRGKLAVTRVVRAVQPQDEAAAGQAEAFVRAALNGQAAASPPLQPPPAGPFVQRAWQALAGVRRGEVISYGELARRAGSPRAVRAAGQACATNALPLFIPCHRVLAAGGRLGGFTGGLAWKRHLLAGERGAGGAS